MHAPLQVRVGAHMHTHSCTHTGTLAHMGMRYKCGCDSGNNVNRYGLIIDNYDTKRTSSADEDPTSAM